MKVRLTILDSGLTLKAFTHLLHKFGISLVSTLFAILAVIFNNGSNYEIFNQTAATFYEY